MSLNKRIKGDFTIESIDSGDQIIMHQAGGITINADLTVSGTSTEVDQEISLKEQAIPTLLDGVAGYNALSAGTTGPGGTGLYFVNDSVTDELVSKKKAIVYGIIF